MTEGRDVTAFAPATVSNLACGFDVFGLALERPGDEVVARRSDEPGVTLLSVQGDGGRLPREVRRNSAGVATRTLLDRLVADEGVELELRKGLPLASGLGGSGASAVAAVVAVDRLLGAGQAREVLLECAVEGERAACGSRHADNVAPALYGGLVLVRSVTPPDVIRLPVADGMAVAVVRPHAEVETGTARRAVGDRVDLDAAVAQWANTAALVAGLYEEDWGLVTRALVDAVAEPVRAPSVPGFSAAVEAARDAGALGSSLSGSGPSIFALCRTLDEAGEVGRAMQEAVRKRGGVGADLIVSSAAAPGARVVEAEGLSERERTRP